MSDDILWGLFAALFAALIVIDILSHRKEHDTGKHVMNVVIFISAAMLFGLLVLYGKGGEAAASYYAAYVIELAMSVDNLFVFIVIFSAFAIPDDRQHRVLFWGIIGAMALRALFVVAGAGLLARFHFVMVIFGVILILTAFKTAFSKEKEGTDSLAFKLSRHIPATDDMSSGRFLARVDGKLLATPLLLCLVVIELSDIIFAFDSIPAALSITTDVLIVFTSNILAVTGLRSLYFVIKGAVGSLRYLKYGLALILAFIGTKMLLGAFDIFEVGVVESLLVIVAILLVTVAVSLLSGKPAEE